MDAELMGGALAATVAAGGEEAMLLHLTRGERGHPELETAEFAEQLEGEMAAAAQTLGVRHRWAALPAPLPPPEEHANALAGVLAELGPRIVLTHWVGSWHESHRRAHAAVRSAVARQRRQGRAIDLLYGENCEDLTGFVPVGFADVDAIVDRWLDAVRSYELFRRSEEHPDVPIPYAAYYKAALRVRGLQAGLARAVAVMPSGHELSSETRERFVWLDVP
jgi:LmbE family N-acetylglucosaminyl deacetylase